MAGPAATMKDVAAKAGVSLSTVSYVLSGARSISEPTRRLILKAMDDLHFQPNAVARALASKRTRVIALLLAPRDRSLGISDLEFVRGASEAARALDHHLVLLTEGMDSEAELAYLKGQGLIDGVILMEVHLDDPRLLWLQRLGLPFSILGRPGPSVKLPFVDIDFDVTLGTVLDHLAALGHRRIGFVNQSQGAFDAGYGPVVRTHQAFVAEATSRGLEPAAVFCPSGPRDGWAACAALLDSLQPPTALVVMNERALPGILQALASRNVRVPEDLSVVSAVTSPTAAQMMMPALTSADAPSHELARLAVANLVRTIENPGVGLESVLLPCLLTVRSSTGPCPESSRTRKYP